MELFRVLDINRIIKFNRQIENFTDIYLNISRKMRCFIIFNM